MATTKKSTKAKTKTAAARTAKTTKTTSKRAPTKVAKKATSKTVSSTVRNQTTLLIDRLNLVSLAVSGLLALAAAYLMSNRTYELVNGLIAKDELASKSGPAVYVPAAQHVFDLQLRWALVGGLLITAIVPLLIATTYKARYAAAIKARVNALRWIDMAIVSIITIEIVALLSGINDILVLKVLGGLMAVTCILGWIAEKRNVQAGRPVKSELFVSVVTGILPWVLILGYALSTYFHGRIVSPWYVYALYAVVAAGFISYCLNLKAFVLRKVADYQLVERNALVITIVLKVAFAAVLIAGLRK